MQSSPEIVTSKTSLYTGRFLSGFSALFLLFDGVTKVLKIQPVIDAYVRLGYNPNLSVALGGLLLICLALYLIPRTSILGAILLTGYLGGAVATNLRVASPFISTTLFPVYVGILVWGGLYLQSTTVRALIPFKK